MSHKWMAVTGLWYGIGSVLAIKVLWLEVSSTGLGTSHGVATAIVGSFFALALVMLGMLGIRMTIVALRNIRSVNKR